MAQATKPELDAIRNTQNNTNDANENPDTTNNEQEKSQHYYGALTEDDLKNQAKELNDLMDPSKLSTTQQTCIAQIVACFIANHIHRYYHCHKYVATMNNKLNNLNMNQIIQNDDNQNTDNNQHEDAEEHNELHLMYPIPILKPPPKTLFTENKDNDTNEPDINDTEQKDIGFSMSSIIKNPQYYCSITSTDMLWAKSFLQSFCEYLNIPNIQIQGYLYFLENSWIEPQPFFQTLGWKKSHNLLRIPLLLLQFAISHHGYYDARLRSLLKCIITYCNISWQTEFILREYSFGIILHVLLEKKEAKSSTKKYGRWAKIGAVGVVSGVVIAVTGGLAAPAVAAGLGAIGLTATGTFLLSTTGTATLYLLFGAAGAGYAGRKMHNTVSEINDFKFISLSSQKNNNQHNGLNVIITVNGWLQGIETTDDTCDDTLSDEADIESASYWRDIMSENGDIHLRSDCYTLQFEKECLLSLGEGLKKFVAQRAVSGTVWTAAKVGVGYTAFATLITALTWPVTLLAVADYIDNPWSVAFAKSKEAGLVLADCLASGNHGRRPVTLIGYSLGARVIYYALKELVRKQHENEDKESEIEEKKDEESASKFKKFLNKRKHKNKEKEKVKVDLSSIIENVVILGGPLTCDVDRWKDIRRIVSDRIINCYSVNDWVLKFVYRTAAATQSVAGLMPIQCDGVENMDLSDCIDGHAEYYQKTPILIKYLIESCGLHL